MRTLCSKSSCLASIFLVLSFCCVCLLVHVLQVKTLTFWTFRLPPGAAFRIVGLWLSCEIAFSRAVVPWHHPPVSRRLTSLIVFLLFLHPCDADSKILNPHACPASHTMRVKHIRLGRVNERTFLSHATDCILQLVRVIPGRQP